jgi:putative ABC transport system substrate-binding protein
MHEGISMGYWNSRSNNRKSKTCAELSRSIQNPKWLGLSVFTFVLVVAGAVAEAQQASKVYRVGYLSGRPERRDEVFRQGLRDLGYVEGKNILIEYRYAEGKFDRLPELARDMVGLNVHIMVTTGTPMTRAAKLATQKIPIVFVVQGDPVETGLVESLARPGGNLTGLTTAIDEVFGGKRLELLKEAVPKISSVALLQNPDMPTTPSFVEYQRDAAKALGLRFSVVQVMTATELDGVFATMRRGRVGGVIVDPTVFFGTHYRRVVELAAKNRLPAVYGNRQAVEAGGLLYYGSSGEEYWRRAATYVDKILKGTKPSDLPVERPIKFELMINLKAAKEIGVTIAPNLLARADKIIR